MDYLGNFIFSANVVIPLMSVVIIGYIVRQLNIIDDKTVSQCNSLTFKVFLPILLLNNVRNTSLDSITSPGLFVMVTMTIVLSFFVVTFIVMAIERDNRKRSVMIQGICRSNYALFGLPLINLLQPDSDLALASLLVAIVIPLYNILSVIVFSIFGHKKPEIKKVIISIATNPLIIGTFIGGILLFANIELPTMIDSSINSIAVIASPFALFMLGARFDLKQIGRIGKQLVAICLGRLIVLPTIIIMIAIALGFRDMELTCIMVIFCAPTAASSYVMAETMGGDGDLAAATVVSTTLFSIFTMFVVIFALNSLGFI